MSRSVNKTSLSKSVLEMKFMKKSRHDFANEEDAYRWSMYQQTYTEGKGGILGNYVVEPSFVPCEDLAIGRLSFKGMNPEIERLMELEEDPFFVKPEVVEDNEVDISNEQMAEQYNSLINSVKRKFQKPTKKRRHDEPYIKKQRLEE